MEGQRPADKPAQGNALGNGWLIDPTLKGRNNMAMKAHEHEPPLSARIKAF